MDALLQCLATISCIGEFSGKAGKSIIGKKPKVFFVGTHSDLVSKADVESMEKELKAAIKNTSWYKKEVIQYATEESLIFAVNNFDETDASFDQIRQAIEQLSQTDGYKIEAPAPWLTFELTLRSKTEKVISIDESKEIAEKCNVQLNQVSNALGFLHNKIGSIRHYQQIPELKNTVIIKTQVLFTIVTNLLVSTFPDGRTNDKFRERGCFTKEELKKVGNIHNSGLSLIQVIALLKYLHILAPLKAESEDDCEYFLPCVLSHAPKPDKDQLQSKGTVSAPPLLIGFKCGYTPKGVFSGLVSYMLQHAYSGCLKWSLDEDCIFRDQATFIIGATGYCLTITNLTKYLCLKIHKPENQSNSIINNSRTIYKSVLNSITEALDVVRKRLNYTCDTDPLFGFYCDHTDCSNDEPHPSFILKRGNSILMCSKHARHTAYLNQDQQKWIPNDLISYGFMKRISEVVKDHWMNITQAVANVFKQKKVILLSVFMLLLAAWYLILYDGINFDVKQLQEDSSYVKQTQQKYYDKLCSEFPNFLSCELNTAFQSSSNMQPMALQLLTQDYDFEDVSKNCESLVLSASFNNCRSKPCQNPMREIQNGFIQYLDKCSLFIENSTFCWPIVHHLIGFTFTFNNQKIYIYDKFPLDLYSLLAVNSFLHLYYSMYYKMYSNQCTRDIRNAVDKELKIEDLLAILQYIMYTKPHLSPVLILKNIDKAFTANGSTSEAMDNILYHISTQTSSIRWLTPIIATASDPEWFNQTKYNGTLMKDYFPVLLIV